METHGTASSDPSARTRAEVFIEWRVTGSELEIIAMESFFEYENNCPSRDAKGFF
jgi:hypothetical protein